MKIYTKSGDDGSTGLFAGPRVSKDDIRIEAYGQIDELNAWLGWLRSTALRERLPAVAEAVDLDGMIERIQSDLFAIGAQLATPEPTKHNTRLIQDDDVERLERWIDALESGLPPLRRFILPSGSATGAGLHVARTVCRRAERRVVTLMRHADPSAEMQRVVRYLNRLSDLLFVAARWANREAGVQEAEWSPGG